MKKCNVTYSLVLGLLLAACGCKRASDSSADTIDGRKQGSWDQVRQDQRVDRIVGDATKRSDVRDVGGISIPVDSRAELAAPSELLEQVTPESLAATVETQRIANDLVLVAKPRAPGSSNWQAVQDLCAQRLTELGFEVELQAYATGVNVVGVRQGTAAPDERVVLSAHYDHIDNCDGADDNASGVAGALEAARVLSVADFRRTLVVAFWDEEEGGLRGSNYYATQAKSGGEKIQVAYVFEMIGYRSLEPGSQALPLGFDLLFPAQSKVVKDNGMKGDFIALIADTGAHGASLAIETFGKSAGLPVIVIEQSVEAMLMPALGDLRRSDHASFWESGYPAIMITDTSEFRYPNYHFAAGADSVEMLDLAFAASVVSATVFSCATELGLVQ